jgi:hypothetical protein
MLCAVYIALFCSRKKSGEHHQTAADLKRAATNHCQICSNAYYRTFQKVEVGTKTPFLEYRIEIPGEDNQTIYRIVFSTIDKDGFIRSHVFLAFPSKDQTHALLAVQQAREVFNNSNEARQPWEVIDGGLNNGDIYPTTWCHNSSGLVFQWLEKFRKDTRTVDLD